MRRLSQRAARVAGGPGVLLPCPAGRVRPEFLRRLLIGSGVAHVVATAVLAPSEVAMRRANGRGIVAFELAGSAERAASIVSSWGLSGRRAARRSLVGDFGYMLTYGVLLTAVVEFARRRVVEAGCRRWAVAGTGVEWLPLAAVGCDVVEGVALLRLLHGRGPAGTAGLARRVAVAKFACVGMGVGYSGVAAGYAWVGSPGRHEVLAPGVHSRASPRGVAGA